MTQLLNHPPDVSEDFYKLENEYYVAGPVTSFDADRAEGMIQWLHHSRVAGMSFNQMNTHLRREEKREIFHQQYDVDPCCSFSISFITRRTLRIRMTTTGSPTCIQVPSLMLDGEPGESDEWRLTSLEEDKAVYSGGCGIVEVGLKSFLLRFLDSSGKVLSSVQGQEILDAAHPKTIPLMFIRRASDRSRSVAIPFSLAHDEKIYGGGESFTSLNKRGQKLVLWSTDVQSAATRAMYKPVPFFMSSRGYGMFLHTGTPAVFDFGDHYAGSSVVYNGDDILDLFFFIGTPKEMLSEYTSLTGRSPLPPLWSFGLWMSRFSYRSQEEVRTIAEKLREYGIPCDVIHIDAGWFSRGIECDYAFDRDRFPDSAELIRLLREKGFHTSLWQIPYYTPQNPVFEEVMQNRLYVKDGKGAPAAEDAILDFSNDDAVEWYKRKITPLLESGVSVIKADFGEAAPLHGYYASGRTGFFEHNLYPLRYTRLLYELTMKIKREGLIWARSGWAGSQRYPVHWSGDPEVSDAGMAGTLRAGLSLGLSGFSFWSHDIGGFSSAPEEQLFLRWAVFGLLSSHSRIHGVPPREPWEFSEEFLRIFRKTDELRYRLMPYIYTQAAKASAEGLPMVRALLLDYPEEPAAWYIEDAYLFGEDILVAPLLDGNQRERMVYLPEGKWIDYQDKKIYEGGRWVLMQCGDIPGIILVRSGSIIPQLSLSQSTALMDWNNINLIVFADDERLVKAGVYLPDSKTFVEITARHENEGWQMDRVTGAEHVHFHIVSCFP